MSTVTRPLAWWETAPNPTCAAFCTRGHAEDEFKQGGGMVCIHTVAKTAEYEVEVQQWVGVMEDDATDVARDPATIFFCESRDGADLEQLTPQQARDFGRSLARAMEDAAKLVEEHNQ